MDRTHLFAAWALASTAALAHTQTPSFPSRAELVYVRFHIERKGGYAGDVRKDQIRVLEDGRPQEIAVLETASTRDRTVLPEVTLLLDVSSSVMDERLLDEALVREALLGGLHAGSTVALCAFGGRLECFAEPTRDAAALARAFEEALRFGHETRRTGTRLYASVADTARRSAAAGGRAQRAIIVFTDALDTEGGKVDDAVDAARAADVRVYAVKLSQAFQGTAMTRPPFGPRGAPNRARYDYRKLELDALPDETGGRSFEPGTLDEKTVARILREIAADIGHEIVAGYEPLGEATGRKRKVKVELVDRSLGKIRDGERTVVR
jgi:VWFA-related protein